MTADTRTAAQKTADAKAEADKRKTDNEAVASVIVTPGGEPGADDTNDRGVLRTQVLNRAEYAERLAAGASPVADTLLADEPDSTVAITEPAPDTAPAPAVVPVSKATADKVTPDAEADAGVVTVPKPQPTKPTQKATAKPGDVKAATGKPATGKPTKR